MKKYVLTILICSFGLCACRTISMERGTNLSKDGVESATTIASAYDKTTDRLNTQLQSEFLITAVKDMQVRPNYKILREINDTKRELEFRKNVFTKLAESYQAFSDLVNYDAQDTIYEKLMALHNATNDYSILINHQEQEVPDDFSLDTGFLSGLHLSSHKKRVRKASELLRGELEIIQELLIAHRDDKENQIAEDDILEHRLETTKYLYKNGIGNSSSIFNKLMKKYDLTLNTNIIKDGDFEKNELYPLVEVALERNHNQEKELMFSSYDASIDTIHTLITAHQKFEKGENTAFAGRLFLKTIRSYIGFMDYGSSS